LGVSGRLQVSESELAWSDFTDDAQGGPVADGLSAIGGSEHGKNGPGLLVKEEEKTPFVNVASRNVQKTIATGSLQA